MTAKLTLIDRLLRVLILANGIWFAFWLLSYYAREGAHLIGVALAIGDPFVWWATLHIWLAVGYAGLCGLRRWRTSSDL
jgi:hypothetical protein